MKHKFTGKIKVATENVKNRGEIQMGEAQIIIPLVSSDLQLDSNLYFRVCNMSEMTSIPDQSAVKNGMVYCLKSYKVFFSLVYLN